MTKQKWILLAEDDDHDADLALRALTANQSGDVVRVSDGSQAMDCLYRREPFQTRGAGNPALVLLDLKMPKVDGLEALRKIKADAQLKSIPVVVFTSSREEIDVVRSYQLGANAYVVKPVDFQEFMATFKEIRMFWMVINEPPTAACQTTFR